VVKITLEAALELAPKYDQFRYAHAVELDIDHAMPDPEPGVMAVGHGHLKDFIRSSWENTKGLAALIDQRLGIQEGGADDTDN
jgi:hypothetical protein